MLFRSVSQSRYARRIRGNFEVLYDARVSPEYAPSYNLVEEGVRLNHVVIYTGAGGSSVIYGSIVMFLICSAPSGSTQPTTPYNVLSNGVVELFYDDE